MAKKKEIFNYANEAYAPLRDPMRAVVQAYGRGMWWFAKIKEVTWAEWGLRAVTDGIHALEHKQPERIDAFKEMLAQWGLEIEYPQIEELGESLEDIDRIFEVCVEIIDEINKALAGFIRATNNGEFEALARQAEQLQIENAADRAWLLQAWTMYDNGGMSLSSFDNWVAHLLDKGD